MVRMNWKLEKFNDHRNHLMKILFNKDSVSAAENWKIRIWVLSNLAKINCHIVKMFIDGATNLVFFIKRKTINDILISERNKMKSTLS